MNQENRWDWPKWNPWQFKKIKTSNILGKLIENEKCFIFVRISYSKIIFNLGGSDDNLLGVTLKFSGTSTGLLLLITVTTQPVVILLLLTASLFLVCFFALFFFFFADYEYCMHFSSAGFSAGSRWWVVYFYFNF